VDEDNVLSSQEPAPKITKSSPLGVYPSSDEESEDLSREVKGLPSIVSKAVKGADPTGASDNDEYRSDWDSDDDAETITASVRKAVKGKSVAISASQRGKMNYNAILRSYNLDDEVPVVMLISLKAGALGLQLTAANNVFLMDPWWQEGIESQAIDRCNRIGQTRHVKVYQMIAENTVESKVLEIQERKRMLIKEAFSATKSTEKARSTKKEARLQDLIKLFGDQDGVRSNVVQEA